MSSSVGIIIPHIWKDHPNVPNHHPDTYIYSAHLSPKKCLLVLRKLLGSPSSWNWPLSYLSWLNSPNVRLIACKAQGMASCWILPKVDGNFTGKSMVMMGIWLGIYWEIYISMVMKWEITTNDWLTGIFYVEWNVEWMVIYLWEIYWWFTIGEFIGDGNRWWMMIDDVEFTGKYMVMMGMFP